MWKDFDDVDNVLVQVSCLPRCGISPCSRDISAESLWTHNHLVHLVELRVGVVLSSTRRRADEITHDQQSDLVPRDPARTGKQIVHLSRRANDHLDSVLSNIADLVCEVAPCGPDDECSPYTKRRAEVANDWGQ